MGFFARLKWLFVGEGEAPSSFKSNTQQPYRRPEHGGQNRPPMQGRDRNDRGPRGDHRDNRDSRNSGGRFQRDARDSRDSRDNHDRQPRPGYGRDNNERPFGDRDRGQSGPRRNGGGPQSGGYGRRDSFDGNDSGFPRPIERPVGGPSSTMRPAQSSVQAVAPVPVARPEQQGPEKIGMVTSYLEDARVAMIKIDKGSLRSGDWIEIQGNISSLRQKVDSLQLDSQPIQEASEGQEVGIRVIRPVKVGDAIVRLRG